ncbi:hypothetical protein Sango_2999900 [Sesamum angolense]|uniref:DDE Tnp4 domain-containing protein n=1 Tax=Sesamum angolense TaxID=2727404 RepID=A0AAE1T4L1_9LAMI|nr:hypothetical protein Sango_2999900 [Sesamum angolense]
MFCLHNLHMTYHEKGCYRTHKGQVAMNVLGIPLHTIKEDTPKSIHDNYYLCDNGYANAEGFLTPHRGVRYHLREWNRGYGGPQNCQELFNLRHSFTRNVIKRTFGLLEVPREESRNMVTIEDDNAWADYVKMDPTAKEMHYKSWHFFTAWTKIFGKDCVNGDCGADPYKDANDIRIEEPWDTLVCYVPADEWNPDIGFISVEEEPPSSFNVNVDPIVNSSSATKRIENTSRKHKVHEAIGDIPKLVEMHAVILQHTRDLETFDENKQLMVTHRPVKDPKKMGIFLDLSKDSRVKWVRLLLVAKRAKASDCIPFL